MLGWGKKKKAEVEHPHYGWKPGTEAEYIKKDDGTYVRDCEKDYRIATEADFQKFREFADDASEAWALKAEKKEIFVFDRPSQDKSKCAVNIVKLFAEFKNVKPEVLYDALHDAEYRTTWDTGMIEGYNLVHLDANNDVGYYHLKLPTGVANRDFCNQRSWRNFDNKEFIIMNHSEPHERCPPTKAVRGESIISGYLIRPHGEGCSLTYVSQSDPKGWIPVMVLNTLLTSQGPNMIEKLVGAATKYTEWKQSNNPGERFWYTEPQPWVTPPAHHTIEWFAAKTGTTLEAIVGEKEAEVARSAAEAQKTRDLETAPAAERPEAEEEKKEEKEEEEEKKDTETVKA